MERLQTQAIKNPRGYFLALLSDAEYGLHEQQEKQRKQQLQMQMMAMEKANDADLHREMDTKKKISAWASNNPKEFERLIQEEKTKLE